LKDFDDELDEIKKSLINLDEDIETQRSIKEKIKQLKQKANEINYEKGFIIDLSE